MLNKKQSCRQLWNLCHEGIITLFGLLYNFKVFKLALWTWRFEHAAPVRPASGLLGMPYIALTFGPRADQEHNSCLR